MVTWDLFWSPEGRKIATVTASDAKAALKMTPVPWRKFLGEVYAVQAEPRPDFTVNNYPVGIYQEGEIYIQTDAPENLGTQVGVNKGRVYLRIVDIERLLVLAKSTKEGL